MPACWHTHACMLRYAHEPATIGCKHSDDMSLSAVQLQSPSYARSSCMVEHALAEHMHLLDNPTIALQQHDIADPNASSSVLIPTSPKSIEACFRLGIDPLELAYKPLPMFKKAEESEELTQLRFQHHEQLRQVIGRTSRVQ